MGKGVAPMQRGTSIERSKRLGNLERKTMSGIVDWLKRLKHRLRPYTEAVHGVRGNGRPRFPVQEPKEGPMPELSATALAELNAALERYERAYEQAIGKGLISAHTWEHDYRRCTRKFVQWLNGTFDPCKPTR